SCLARHGAVAAWGAGLVEQSLEKAGARAEAIVQGLPAELAACIAEAIGPVHDPARSSAQQTSLRCSFSYGRQPLSSIPLLRVRTDVLHFEGHSFSYDGDKRTFVEALAEFRRKAQTSESVVRDVGLVLVNIDPDLAFGRAAPVLRALVELVMPYLLA